MIVEKVNESFRADTINRAGPHPGTVYCMVYMLWWAGHAFARRAMAAGVRPRAERRSAAR